MSRLASVFQQIGNATRHATRCDILAASNPITAHAVCEGVLGPNAPCVRVVVGVAASRPSRHRDSAPCAAIRLPAAPGLVMVDADGLQAPQHQHGAVDIVHAPAPEPGAVRLLLVADELDRPLHRASFWS